MSFQATRSHHRVTIEGSEGLSRNGVNHNLIDNITVDQLKVEDASGIGVLWTDENGDPTVILKKATVDIDYHFSFTNVVDSTNLFRERALYTFCFVNDLGAEDLKDIQVNIDVGDEIQHRFENVSLGEELCINFLSEERVHRLRFEAFDDEGENLDKLLLSANKFTFESFGLNADEPVPVADFSWTRPDGTVSTDFEQIVDQEGIYEFNIETCLLCTKTEILKIEIDNEICPHTDRVFCEESINPNINSRLRLRQPEEPYSIGNFDYEDTFSQDPCLDFVDRTWTVERLRGGILYDTVSCFNRIEIIDSEAPIIPELAEKEISCLDSLPDAQLIGVFDNCSELIELDYQDIRESLSLIHI